MASPPEELAWRPGPEANSIAYFEAVRQETRAFLHGLAPEDCDFAPERPPAPDRPRELTRKIYEGCTIGRMFRQLVGEFNQHLGQIQYVRGLQKGLNQVENAPLPSCDCLHPHPGDHV